MVMMMMNHDDAHHNLVSTVYGRDVRECGNVGSSNNNNNNTLIILSL